MLMSRMEELYLQVAEKSSEREGQEEDLVKAWLSSLGAASPGPPSIYKCTSCFGC